MSRGLSLALVIFAGLSAATWYAPAACYVDTPDVGADPNDSTVAACPIGAVALACFVPFSGGDIAGLVARAAAAYGFPNLPAGRATVLVGYLAARWVVSRLVVPGVLTASDNPTPPSPRPSIPEADMPYLIAAIVIWLIVW